MKTEDVAWNLIANHSQDTSIIKQLVEDLKIKNQDDLKNASADTLKQILGLIKDKSYFLVAQEVFKFFPNFDDGSVGNGVFNMAERNAVAEENIKIDML